MRGGRVTRAKRSLRKQDPQDGQEKGQLAHGCGLEELLSVCCAPRQGSPVRGLLHGPTAAAGMFSKGSSSCPSTAPLISGRSGSPANSEHTDTERDARPEPLLARRGLSVGCKEPPEEGGDLKGFVLSLPEIPGSSPWLPCPSRGSFPMETPCDCSAAHTKCCCTTPRPTHGAQAHGRGRSSAVLQGGDFGD